MLRDFVTDFGFKCHKKAEMDHLIQSEGKGGISGESCQVDPL